jgi:hypothetical protein
MNEEFTYDVIETLYRKILKVKSKKTMMNIYDIIKNNGNADKITENINGIYIIFNELNQNTYKDLNDYINNLMLLAKDKIQKPVLEYNEYSKHEFPFEDNSRLRYSNKEKNIIKRKQIYTDESS